MKTSANLLLQRAHRDLIGTVHLDGSKSISNRVLIIRALSNTPFQIKALSTSRDTLTLESLLQQARKGSDSLPFDAGAAGTTFRFLTAYFAFKDGTQTLTGSARMLQRPIGVLVEALRGLGAHIEYLGKAGYPPLRIHPPHRDQATQSLTIAAGTSSQYISALLLIAPTLPGGLTLHLEGTIVSRPYIEMTLALQAYFGVTSSWEGNQIHIQEQPYVARPFIVEADWSAASYFYSMGALASKLDLQLHGLFQESLQGDAVLSEMMTQLGINTHFTEKGIHLTKNEHPLPARFDWDFLKCPDLAQTLAVSCGALGIPASFSGLGTLRIKETDRIAALEQELAKVGVQARGMGDTRLELSGRANWKNTPLIKTYEDHRMALSFAALALLQPIRIAESRVVEKSYPGFWEDLKRLDFSAEPAD